MASVVVSGDDVRRKSSALRSTKSDAEICCTSAMPSLSSSFLSSSRLASLTVSKSALRILRARHVGSKPTWRYASMAVMSAGNSPPKKHMKRPKKTQAMSSGW